MSEQQGVVVLGSTGSIGRNTLEVIAALPERFRVIALAAGRNRELLQEQIHRFQPRYASCLEGSQNLNGTTVLPSDDAMTTLATTEDADIVVVATTGHAAIEPTIVALQAGKIVALANKETIVAAGELVMDIARTGPGELRPVDSEHSAIWQCLGTDRVDRDQVARLILTASGGPFRDYSIDRLLAVTREDALRHPTWNMGAKVTIDSATLMNKGLELIEAHWLFDCPFEMLEVVIHPQSLVHSFVEYADGSILAQFASHDMRLPIQYALTFPDRAAGPANRLNVLELSRLDFEPPDHERFPLLALAKRAGEAGLTFPAVLSAADMVAVDAFLAGQIRFTDVPKVVQGVLDSHAPASESLTLDAVIDADQWADQQARQLITRYATR